MREKRRAAGPHRLTFFLPFARIAAAAAIAPHAAAKRF